MRHWALKILIVFFLLPLAAFGKKPKINGQVSVTILPGSSYTIKFEDLQVDDPDYPEGYSLHVFNGKDYILLGNSVIPNLFFKGRLKVPVTVENDDDESKKFDFIIDVAIQQDEPPTITGQSPISTNEGEPVTVEFSHLTVSDPDSNYPDGFTLTLYDGENYTITGTTVTPNAGFSGVLTVPVSVNDGVASSETFNLQITVVAAPNQPPTITGQTALSTSEDTPLTILLSHLTVTDPDNTYPDGFTLNVAAGTNYTVNGTTITPAPGFSGTLTIPVTVNDGVDDSEPFSLSVTITNVNSVPVITGQTVLTTPRNTPITVQFSNLTVQDSDNTYPTGFTMTLAAGLNYSVSGTTITPTADFTGSLTVPVTVSDGTDTSAPFNLTIGVEAPANVAPVITGQTPVTITANSTATLQLSQLTVNDPDDTYPTGFTLQILPGTNYTVNANVVTPALNFTGTLTVKIVVNDGEADSQPFNFNITVNPTVNVAPKITGQVPISINENAPFVVELAHLIVTDPDNTFPADFSLAVIGGQNYSVVGDVITPSLNFTGVLAVRVTVNDGQSTSPVFDLQVTVVETVVNQPPVITGQVGLSTFKGTAIALSLANITVSDPDNIFPQDFKLKILPGLNYVVVGSSIRPAATFLGTLGVTIVVNDGKDDSAPFTLKIQVIEKNVLQIIGQVPLSVPEDSSLVLRLGDLKVNDNESAYPTGFTLNIAPGEHYTIANSTIIPEANYAGNLTVGVTVSKGTTTTPLFNALVVVTPVNDSPHLENLEATPLFYNASKGTTYLTESAVVTDADDNELLLAEVGFDEAIYQPGSDYLEFENTINIRGIFDSNAGVLTLIGTAPLEEYTTAIQRVQYWFANGDTLPSTLNKTIWFRLNDGKMQSEKQSRVVTLGENFVLDIPNAFTPNDDQANDTWRIGVSSQTEALNDAIIRVYNKRGMMVYEAKGLQSEWDGRYNGEVLPMDTYFYTIELNLPFTKSRHKGVVMILK